jgi:hypothetical protein
MSKWHFMMGLLDEMMDELQRLTEESPGRHGLSPWLLRDGFQADQAKRPLLRTRSVLVDYYRFLWKDYDDWVHNSYKESPIIDIDVDQKNIIYNAEDKAWLLAELKNSALSIKTPRILLMDQRTEIDLLTYPKRNQYAWFSTFPDPSYGFDVDIDVDSVVALAKSRGDSFFPYFLLSS